MDRPSRSARSQVALAAEALGGILKSARADLEQWLPRWLTDIAAHRVELTAGYLSREWDEARQRSAAMIGEYLAGEIGIIPLKAEMRALTAEVSQLHEEVERLAQRIARFTGEDSAP
jgi:ubiquinone biosynthesis protein UbiJ